MRGGRGGHGHDIRFESQAFGRQGGKPLAAAISRQIVNCDRLPIRVTEIAQAIEEGGGIGSTAAYLDRTS